MGTNAKDAAATTEDRAELVNPSTVSTWLEAPLTSHDRAAERRHKAQELLEIVGGRKGLEALHAEFVRRLHRTSDDYGATEGLRVTLEALKLVPLTTL